MTSPASASTPSTGERAGNRPPTSPERSELLAGCAAAHARLVDHLDGVLTADIARAPSRLAGWSVGHVLTHLARHADSHVPMFVAASRGEIPAQYPGGMSQRAQAIEAGAGRSADELLADVRRSIVELEAAWATCTELGWSGTGLVVGGEATIESLPFRRWREVEVHHADLGLAGFTCSSWSSGYVRRELDQVVRTWASRRPMGLTSLPPAALALAPPIRLAWLLGRLQVDGLDDPGPWG